MEKNTQIIKIKAFDVNKKIDEIKIEAIKRLEEVEKYKKTAENRPKKPSFRNLF